ncbi:MAG: hypothetical protein K0Q51_775 [Rickettsiaceae bacterium]|jgi:hypothetical protein|nr:hypothetical protein [Rickettsiaceae bacterium]
MTFLMLYYHICNISIAKKNVFAIKRQEIVDY